MRIAVVCWRPYQVFNAIRIITSGIIGKKNQYDLYIQNLQSLLILRKKLFKVELFKHVYTFEEKTQGHTTLIRLKRIINYIFCYQALKQDDLSGVEHSYTHYDIIIAAGWASYFVELVNANPKAMVYMFEDGTAVFFGDERFHMAKSHAILYKVLNALFKRGPFSVNVDRIYVNNYNMIKDKFHYKVFEIPKIDVEQARVLKAVYGELQLEQYRGKDIVYLSQTKTEYSVDKYDDLIMCKPLRSIKEKVIIRPHPKWPFQPPGFDVDTSETMWELLINELTDVILISEHSTAMFTPQMLYNKKFTLIFLYRFMCNNQMIIKEFDTIVRILRETNDYIYTPNTYEEYVDLITTIIS